MIDVPMDRPADAICPWCSASLALDAAVCPSCGAILTADDGPDLPGVTAVDAHALRNEKAPASRNRLLSWISGEYPEDVPSAADAHAIAPPDPDVQREIRRLELEAEVANLQAEADAMLSEAVAEGRVVEIPEDLRPFATLEPTGEAPGEPALPDADHAPGGDAPPA